MKGEILTKKKILFGITSCTFGGAERVLIDLCNQLCEEYDITIFTIYAKGEMEPEIDPRITLKSLYPFCYAEMPKWKKILLPISLFLRKNSIYHKKIKGDFETEIAFLEGPITNLFSVRNLKTKKIAWIHNDISQVFGKGLKAKIKQFFNRKTYQRFQEIIFVSQDNLEKFEEMYVISTPKQVIYNYIDSEKVIEKSKQISKYLEKDCPIFVSVCRLVEQKAIGRLIKVHSQLIKEGKKHKIYVVGDGPLKQELQEQIKQEKVENTFILLGKQANPYPYVKQADAFCLFSYYEGYPMVVEEAKILNQFICVTDTAVREVLRNYNRKMIVENTENGIKEGIKQFVENKEKYIEQDIEFHYSNEEILERIKRIF